MKKVGMISLGCAKNRVDSENMLGMLAARGFEIVGDPAEADLLFVNTCGFIESAKEESIDAILEMAQYKKLGDKKLFVTGCLAQRYPDALMSEIPEIDGLMGVAEYARLFDREVDNSKVLSVTGLKQEDMMPLYDGLKYEISRTPRDIDWGTNVRMDEYLAAMKR
jgi:ribosomal protein S12 methylthiotransferase